MSTGKIPPNIGNTGQSNHRTDDLSRSPTLEKVKGVSSYHFQVASINIAQAFVQRQQMNNKAPPNLVLYSHIEINCSSYGFSVEDLEHKNILHRKAGMKEESLSIVMLQTLVCLDTYQSQQKEVVNAFLSQVDHVSKGRSDSFTPKEVVDCITAFEESPELTTYHKDGTTSTMVRPQRKEGVQSPWKNLLQQSVQIAQQNQSSNRPQEQQETGVPTSLDAQNSSSSVQDTSSATKEPQSTKTKRDARMSSNHAKKIPAEQDPTNLSSIAKEGKKTTERRLDQLADEHKSSEHDL